MLKPPAPPPKFNKKIGVIKTTNNNRNIALATTVGVTIGTLLINRMVLPVQIPAFMKVESFSGLTEIYLNTKSIKYFNKNKNDNCYYICTEESCLSNNDSYKYRVCKKDNRTTYSAIEHLFAK